MNRTVFLFALLVFFSCGSQTGGVEIPAIEKKVNGLSLVSMNKLLDKEEILPILQTNANWTSVIPFAFLPDENKPGLVFDSEWQWIGERIEGAVEAIQLMHKSNVSVMLKPQIWVGRGVFTGEIQMNNESDWKKFEQEYGNFILTFAKLAEREKVEMLCVGTEMHHVAVDRPFFWKELIKEIRIVYSGKVTYAENWDCYDQVPFWNDLDFIGIDAYFPIAEGNNPSDRKLYEGWKKLDLELSSYSEKLDKSIIFTEYGYRSIAACAESPWNYKSESNVSEQAQYRALKALYDVMWEKPYFAGGFLWKWYPDHINAGGSKNTMFTVQNKKAEELVRSRYGD